MVAKIVSAEKQIGFSNSKDKDPSIIHNYGINRYGGHLPGFQLVEVKTQQSFVTHEISRLTT